MQGPPVPYKGLLVVSGHKLDFPWVILLKYKEFSIGDVSFFLNETLYMSWVNQSVFFDPLECTGLEQADQ